MTISKSNKLEAHYFFSDESHGFDAVVRNECEKELLQIYHEIAKALDLKLLVQSEPPKDGGFVEFWTFLGQNTSQITIIVSAVAIILSRRPVENKKLTQLQIENLELENELKRNELRNLQLKTLKGDELNDKLIINVVNLLSLNYKIIWRRSNFYKKMLEYRRINKFSSQRFLDETPIGQERQIKRSDFPNFILSTDELPDNEIKEAEIDLISPVLKSGNFLWKGFLKNQIVPFEMQDNPFKSMIQNGEMMLNNKVTINTLLIQKRKIDENGLIKITKSIVKLVIDYRINGVKYITKDGQNYLNKK